MRYAGLEQREVVFNLAEAILQRAAEDYIRAYEAQVIGSHLCWGKPAWITVKEVEEYLRMIFSEDVAEETIRRLQAIATQRAKGGTKKVQYGKRYCDKCKYLKHEEWPKGAGAMRCMMPGRRCGRTVDYSDINSFSAVLTPEWCKHGPQEGENEA